MENKDSSGLRQQRKLDHIKALLEHQDGPQGSGLADLTLVHQAIPRCSFAEVDCSTELWGRRLDLPLIINAMTGGPEASGQINAALARAARATGVGMAVGSQKVAIDNPRLEWTFAVAREENPSGLLLANISALSGVEDLQRAVEMIAADAVQLHLNAAQELAMAEGERGFGDIADNIARLVQASPVPVVVKEVGFGFSREAALTLYNCGVRWVDVSGQGGTNFIAIEEARAGGEISALANWGLPTAVSLVEVLSAGVPLAVLASGGIRSSLDLAKTLALGARAGGVAGYFLRILLQQSFAALQEEISRWRRELQAVMLLIGAATVEDMRRCPVIIRGQVREWLEQRGIPTAGFARR
ncbi:MAG: type 2 isopentenyl-diphosphate Delta-isomerase [Clostridia bacterium]|nr:MAG: type 2 isopentenyl-diphosphate Delta-isomerase [Clostridia bacterium]